MKEGFGYCAMKSTLFTKIIDETTYEVCGTREDVIDKLRQLQGVCRETISDDRKIEFYCSKKGNISISNPYNKYIENQHSTELFGKVVSENNKTYIKIYVTYNKFTNFLKKSICLIDVLVAVLAMIFVDKPYSFIVLFICFIFFVYNLISCNNEKDSAPFDSDILKQEIEKRIDALKNWDK